VQPGAPDEHLVQLEHAGADRRRKPERAAGAPPRQERLGELGREPFVEREPAELGRGCAVLVVKMTLVRRELLVRENTFLRAKRLSSRKQCFPPLRAEKVQLGAFGFPVNHTLRVHGADRFRISEDAGGVGDFPQARGGRTAVEFRARPDVT
jgi:hypothetical protein